MEQLQQRMYFPKEGPGRRLQALFLKCGACAPKANHLSWPSNYLCFNLQTKSMEWGSETTSMLNMHSVHVKLAVRVSLIELKLAATLALYVSLEGKMHC